MTLLLHKYQALGNDMIVVDPDHFAVPLTPDIVRLLCDRHFGLGADGICYGPLPGADTYHKMRFFNPDGSEAEKSGNGLRIFARYLVDAGYAKDEEFGIRISGAPAWVRRLDEHGQRFAITMGQISFNSAVIPMNGPVREVVGESLRVGDETAVITSVNVGNPHCVLFDRAPESIREIGPLIETHPAFPQRTNVQIANPIDEHNLRITIWERGAGYTMASGTSACATAAAAIRNGYCQSPLTVEMDGGTAVVTIDEQWNAALSGSVAAVFDGQLSKDLTAELLGILASSTD